MTYVDWAEAFSIFAKYATRENYNDVSAFHDVIYAGENVEQITIEDRSRLAELGWKYDFPSGRYLHYV